MYEWRMDETPAKRIDAFNFLDYSIATYFESSIFDFATFFSPVRRIGIGRGLNRTTRIDSIKCANCNMKF